MHDLGRQTRELGSLLGSEEGSHIHCSWATAHPNTPPLPQTQGNSSHCLWRLFLACVWPQNRYVSEHTHTKMPSVLWQPWRCPYRSVFETLLLEAQVMTPSRSSSVCRMHSTRVRDTHQGALAIIQVVKAWTRAVAVEIAMRGTSSTATFTRIDYPCHLCLSYQRGKPW